MQMSKLWTLWLLGSCSSRVKLHSLPWSMKEAPAVLYVKNAHLFHHFPSGPPVLRLPYLLDRQALLTMLTSVCCVVGASARRHVHENTTRMQADGSLDWFGPSHRTFWLQLTLQPHLETCSSSVV